MRGESTEADGGLESDSHAILADDVSSHPHDVRLVPVALDSGELVVSARPVRHTGPAMLRGLSTAHAMAVIPPRGGVRGDSVRVLRLP
jgi:molybdopterin molybdotransferase